MTVEELSLVENIVLLNQAVENDDLISATSIVETIDAILLKNQNINIRTNFFPNIMDVNVYDNQTLKYVLNNMDAFSNSHFEEGVIIHITLARSNSASGRNSKYFNIDEVYNFISKNKRALENARFEIINSIMNYFNMERNTKYRDNLLKLLKGETI